MERHRDAAYTLDRGTARQTGRPAAVADAAGLRHDLLAFCTGTLLDGIESEEKPHAINAPAGALNLDMTRYWTPTRATYFDHVSKARIAEVVSTAESPKVAADIGKMKNAVAAAAAELRLANAAWLPEVLTDREIPVTPSWDATMKTKTTRTPGTPQAKHRMAKTPTPNRVGGNGGEKASNAPRDADTSPEMRSEQPPWPFPTAASVGNQAN